MPARSRSCTSASRRPRPISGVGCRGSPPCIARSLSSATVFADLSALLREGLSLVADVASQSTVEDEDALDERRGFSIAQVAGWRIVFQLAAIWLQH